MIESTRTVLEIFDSPVNRRFLLERLRSLYNDDHKRDYIAKNFDYSMRSFIDTARRELAASDSICPIGEQVASLNIRFIGEQIATLNTEDATETYTLYDGCATTRRGDHFRARGTNDILRSWTVNSGRINVMREDVQSRPLQRDGPITGITICDQSHIGTSRHVDAYENSAYKCALNDFSTYESTPFGVSNKKADDRLLTRRIFRNGKYGENSVPYHEVALYSRPYERDIGESLRDAEKGCLQYGFNMAPLDVLMTQKMKRTML